LCDIGLTVNSKIYKGAGEISDTPPLEKNYNFTFIGGLAK